jgi:hypothetical protein
MRCTNPRKMVGATGFEPATPCAQGGTSGSTGGSGRPLPFVFLRNFATWGNCRKPRAATDCQPIVSQRHLQSRSPIARPTASVRDRNNENAIDLNSVNDAERKASQEVAASAVVVARPRFRQTHDRRFGGVYLLTERDSCRSAPLDIPPSAGLRFVERFVEILKLASHVRLLRGCDDALQPTKSSWRFQRRRVRVVLESLSTTPLLRQRPLRNRDSGLAHPPAPLAPRPAGGAPRPRAAWHPSTEG